MFWSMHSGILAAIATVFARYAGWFVPLGETATRLVAIGAIVVLSAINYLGVSLGGRVQSAFTLVKVAAVVAIIAAGWLLGGSPVAPDPQLVMAPMPSITGANFLLAVAAGLFAFGGWHMVTYTAEETVDPARTIPRSLMIGVVVVTACYIGLNAVYLHVLPIAKVMASTRVAADAFDVLVGPAGRQRDRGPRDVQRLRRAERHRPRRPARVLPDGAGRALVPLGGGHPPQVPDAGKGHPAAGGVVVGAGPDRHLPRALHARGVYGMDLLRAARGRHPGAAPPSRLPSRVAHAPGAPRADRVRAWCRWRS